MAFASNSHPSGRVSSSLDSTLLCNSTLPVGMHRYQGWAMKAISKVKKKSEFDRIFCFQREKKIRLHAEVLEI